LFARALRTEGIVLMYPETPHQMLQEERQDFTVLTQTYHWHYKDNPIKNSALKKAETILFKNT